MQNENGVVREGGEGKEDEVAEVGGGRADNGSDGQDEDDGDDEDDDDRGSDRGVGIRNSRSSKNRVPKTRAMIQTAPLWNVRNTCPVITCKNKLSGEKNRDLIGRHPRWAKKSGKLQPEHAEQHRIWTAAGGK